MRQEYEDKSSSFVSRLLNSCNSLNPRLRLPTELPAVRTKASSRQALNSFFCCSRFSATIRLFENPPRARRSLF